MRWLRELKMPRSLKVDVNPTVFKWLRKSSGWSVEEVSKRLNTSVDVIKSVEIGTWQPTLLQLKELSNAYKRPLALFFLTKPLDEPSLPKDYRLLPDKKDVFDKKTISTIRKARCLQEIGGELLSNMNTNVSPKIDHVSLLKDPTDIGEYYRNQFSVNTDMQQGFKSSYAFLDYLRETCENLNILVFQFPMPVEDARGFVLTDRNPNVIVINSKDTIEARIFTLLHEFGHILLRETVIDLPIISLNKKNRIESWCNQFAASFLLPETHAETLFRNEKTLTDKRTLDRLSKKFKVSRSMLLYSMYKQEFITKDEFEQKLETYRPSKEPQKKKTTKTGGIPQEKKCLREMGQKFVSIVANNYDKNYITYTDALRFLSVKSRNFDKVLAKAKQ
jgi:Zn-dependent peptidase ImmA (M78 family)/transcriptional regulator with XRE-family HTH domain